MISFSLAGLEVTILNRQFPDAADYWDGNWLNVMARCEAEGSSASASGPILHMPELVDWLKALKEMYRTLSGQADLKPIEPNFAVNMTITKMGQIAVSVHLSPNHLTQAHRFDFTIDQSHLPPLIGQLESIVKAFPIKGKPR